MKGDDLYRVYAIEKRSHQTPWSKNTIVDCFNLGYDCRVLESKIGDSWQILGYIISRYQNKSCHILNLAIDPPFQCQGYGKAILQAQFDFLSETNIKRIYLEVRSGNGPALRLYQGMGFKMVGLKKHYYQDSFGKEDAFVFEKEIVKTG